jgi:polar amino acid transport system permease protein
MTAGLALGMSKLKVIKNIMIPQVFRLSIPGWSNELTIVLKDTSIAFSIGVIDLMRQGSYIFSLHYDLIIYVLLIIALIYFIIVISINKILGFLEKKYKIPGLEI